MVVSQTLFKVQEENIFENTMSPWAKIIRIINNNMSSISATDMELLNNQGWYLDMGWLVHLNQAYCVVQSLTRPWLCWKPPSRRLSKVTAKSSEGAAVIAMLTRNPLCFEGILIPKQAAILNTNASAVKAMAPAFFFLIHLPELHSCGDNLFVYFIYQ